MFCSWSVWTAAVVCNEVMQLVGQFYWAEGESFQPLYARWKAALSRLRVFVRQIWCQKYGCIEDSVVSCCRVAQTWSAECEPQHLSEITVNGDHLDVIHIVFQMTAWASTEGCTQITVYEPAAVYTHKQQSQEQLGAWLYQPPAQVTTLQLLPFLYIQGV